jgi:hypothetical protein
MLNNINSNHTAFISEQTTRKGKAESVQMIGSPGPPRRPLSPGGAQIQLAKYRYAMMPTAFANTQ